jgi:hypothetical protein
LILSVFAHSLFFRSASLYVAAGAIKTMDFDMPSYGAISSSKASVANVEGLTKEYDVKEDKPKGMPRKKPEKKERDSEGGNPLGSMLPSVNKGKKKEPKPKPAARERPVKKEKEEQDSVVDYMDMALPSYSETTAAKNKRMFAL